MRNRDHNGNGETMKKKNQPVQIPLRNWHKTKDGQIVNRAYKDCIHYYKRCEITKDCSCHSFTVDSQCIEETEGKPCCLIQWKPGYKSDKIRYIYFKISEQEKISIEQKLRMCLS